eukprot:7211665-Prymnesium_polylepis.1
MYTHAPCHRLTLDKPPSHFRLAAHPPQIAFRLRAWVKRRPGKARAPITMRSEIARQHRPNTRVSPHVPHVVRPVTRL